MVINRSVTKLVAVALAAAAVAAATQPVGARAAGTTISNQGNPNAVPPILPRASSSELAALEAFESVEFNSDPPANARYSNAEMNFYASLGK